MMGREANMGKHQPGKIVSASHKFQEDSIVLWELQWSQQPQTRCPRTLLLLVGWSSLRWSRAASDGEKLPDRNHLHSSTGEMLEPVRMKGLGFPEKGNLYGVSWWSVSALSLRVFAESDHRQVTDTVLDTKWLPDGWKISQYFAGCLERVMKVEIWGALRYLARFFLETFPNIWSCTRLYAKMQHWNPLKSRTESHSWGYNELKLSTL